MPRTESPLAAQQSAEQKIEAYQQLVSTLNAKLDASRSPLQRKYIDYQTMQYDEQIAFMQHRVAVFKWQEFASNVMLWVVVVVVLSGLVFSAAQLIDGLRFGKDLQGNLEISAQGLKVTSSIVGLLVLAMSIAFVLIFVDQIYEIHVVQLGALPARK